MQILSVEIDEKDLLLLERQAARLGIGKAMLASSLLGRAINGDLVPRKREPTKFKGGSLEIGKV
jgi:hypothetical protein